MRQNDRDPVVTAVEWGHALLGAALLALVLAGCAGLLAVADVVTRGR